MRKWSLFIVLMLLLTSCAWESEVDQKNYLEKLFSFKGENRESLFIDDAVAKKMGNDIDFLESIGNFGDIQETENGYLVEYSDVDFFITMTIKNEKIDEISMEKRAKTFDLLENEEQVFIGDYALEGRLSIPEDSEYPPVVIILTGSGPQNMNGTFGKGEITLYKDLAQELCKEGIASLRWNDRTYQAPESIDAKNVVIEDEYIDDFEKAFLLIREDKRFEYSNIYVIGHSEGAMIIPGILARYPDISGGVLLAGTARSFSEIISSQTYQLLIESGESEEAASSRVSLIESRITSIMKSGKGSFQGLYAPYFNSLKEFGASENTEISQPMLILQGESDIQVTLEEDFSSWKKVYPLKENIKYIQYPELNHFFTQSDGNVLFSNMFSDYQNYKKVESVVIEDISSWIKAFD